MLICFLGHNPMEPGAKQLYCMVFEVVSARTSLLAAITATQSFKTVPNHLQDKTIGIRLPIWGAPGCRRQSRLLTWRPSSIPCFRVHQTCQSCGASHLRTLRRELPDNP